MKGEQLPDDYQIDKDLFQIEVEQRDGDGNVEQRDGVPVMAKKYFKNKHFFIDPFELTIAQWCYVKLNSNPDGSRADKDSARDLLDGEGHLSEIENSYWKYIQTFEKSKWNEVKQENGLDNPDDDVNFSMAVQRQIYNPLDDTRPYYYATYRNVRGTAQVYAPVNGSSASTYVIDGAKGDEFQMNSRTTE